MTQHAWCLYGALTARIAGHYVTVCIPQVSLNTSNNKGVMSDQTRSCRYNTIHTHTPPVQWPFERGWVINDLVRQAGRRIVNSPGQHQQQNQYQNCSWPHTVSMAYVSCPIFRRDNLLTLYVVRNLSASSVDVWRPLRN